MQLFISSVSNLTDARFFSAYGISYFGFCFDVLDPNAVTIDQVKEISGWLHEPRIIGQFGDHQTWEEMLYIKEQLPLHAVLVSNQHPDKSRISLPKWIQTASGIIHPTDSGIFVSADWTKELLQQILPINPYGIHIACTKEERPGISKTEYYAELMEILEPYWT